MDTPISPLQHTSDMLLGVAAGAGGVSSNIFLSFFMTVGFCLVVCATDLSYQRLRCPRRDNDGPTTRHNEAKISCQCVNMCLQMRIDAGADGAGSFYGATLSK